jgi:CheY-like chemotaxis protein
MNTIPPTSPDSEGRRQRGRIFYVEDHQDSAEIMIILLTEAGYAVTLAESPEHCLRNIKKGHFDLLLLDSWFEEVSGLELCEQVRACDPDIPIVFYTSAAYAKDIQQGMEAGANVYLVKPNDLQVVIETITRLLGGKSIRA